MREQRNEHVLLVEDTEPTRYVVHRMLADAGFQVAEAASGHEALTAAKRLPDIIILDINLPDMTGFEVCRAIKKDPITSAIPVLHLSSSYARAEDHARGLDAGADGYLTHPVENVVLVATVRAILRARKAEESARAAEAEATRMRTLAEERAAELERARNAAEAANRAKDQFLAVLSHELRTPLSPVFMTVVAMEADPQISTAVREQLAMIRRNIELETKLIDDLLDLSRISNNKLRLDLKPISVNDAVSHALQVCESDIRAKHIQLFRGATAANDRIMADSARLEQALWNVLKNAVKFSHEGGRIRVDTHNVTPDNIVIEIHDTGLGIAAEHLPRIFDAFEQGESNVARQFGGLGLGLAISRAVVQLHGGTISAMSQGKGHGATFTVELPCAPSAIGSKAEGSADRTTMAPSRSLRLLIVEDHQDTAVALVRLLRLSGYQVLSVSTVREALELIAEEHFDLLISDLGLPDESGYELIRKVRETNGLPGIAMSGFGMEEDIRRSEAAGFSAHLVKPVSLPQLESVIRKVLNVRLIAAGPA